MPPPPQAQVYLLWPQNLAKLLDVHRQLDLQVEVKSAPQSRKLELWTKSDEVQLCSTLLDCPHPVTSAPPTQPGGEVRVRVRTKDVLDLTWTSQLGGVTILGLVHQQALVFLTYLASQPDPEAGTLLHVIPAALE